MLLLDIRTLLFMAAVSAGCMGVAIGMAARVYMNSIPGMRRWAWACGGHSLAWALLYLQGTLPAFFTIVLANTVALASVALQYRTLAEFTNRRAHRWPLVLLVLSVACAFLYFTYVYPYTIARHVVIASSTAVLLLLSARTLLHAAVPGTSVWLMGGWCMLIGSGALLRAASLLLFAPATFSLLSTSPMQSVTYAGGALSVLVGSVGFLMMCHERFQVDLRQVATRDALTGSLNRGTIEQHLTEAWQRAQRTGTPLSIVLLDIDYFKTINDTYGHRMGDQVLQDVVLLIRQHLRSGDLIGRYGGEEFLLVLPNTSCDQARAVAERARITIAQKVFAADDATLQCTVSGGVATASGRDRNYTDLVHRADAALYAAKHHGRNCMMLAAEEERAMRLPTMLPIGGDARPTA